MASADPIDLKPFRATYTAEWKGITAAGSILELRRAGPDTYAYSSTSAARGLFRMAFSETLTETSTFRVTDGRIVPLTFRGTRAKELQSLDFDGRRCVSGVARATRWIWRYRRVHGIISLQIESCAVWQPAHARKVWLVDRQAQGIRTAPGTNARVDTALGQLDTVVYTSARRARIASRPGWRRRSAIYP